MKNIILIISDTFRYDNLGDKAQRPVWTPELDRFAAERATSVERVTMGSFPTIPHRTDLTRSILGWPHYGWQALRNSGRDAGDPTADSEWEGFRFSVDSLVRKVGRVTIDHGLDVFSVPGSAENCMPWPTGRGNYLRNTIGPHTAD